MPVKNGLDDEYAADLETTDAIADRLDFEPDDPDLLTTAIEAGREVKRLPCGTFLFLIERIDLGKTRKDNPMLSFQATCQEPDEDVSGKRGFFIIAWPFLPGKGMSADQWRSLCRAVGYEPKKRVVEFTTEELEAAFLSQEITLDVTAEWTNEYGKQNRFAVSKVQL